MWLAEMDRRSDELHVTPVDDWIEHEESTDCVCGPAVHPEMRDDGAYTFVIVHASLDGRELDEHDYDERAHG